MPRKQHKNGQTEPKTHSTQRFSITAPGATSVMLVGDFTHWQDQPISMAKREGSLWTASVPLPPGTHHYRFLVDGQWQDDPECMLRAPNPFGGENSVRTVV